METIISSFLSEALAERAIRAIAKFFFNYFGEGSTCHIVILVPAKVTSLLDYQPVQGWYKIEPYILHEASINKPLDGWNIPLEEIARNMALQLWYRLNPGGDCTVTPPHLLYKNDTPYWGADSMEGIVVSCSGLEPWFNKMISRVVLSILIALARDDWEESEEKAKDHCLLST